MGEGLKRVSGCNGVQRRDGKGGSEQERFGWAEEGGGEKGSECVQGGRNMQWESEVRAGARARGRASARRAGGRAPPGVLGGGGEGDF